VDFGQRLQCNLNNCGCLWSNWDETFHQLNLPVKFGQRLQCNLKNCGCVWMNWDETCHYLGLPVEFGQSLRRNLKIFWMFVVKLGQDLSSIVFACEIRAAPLA
jgi:hypothetical protein